MAYIKKDGQAELALRAMKRQSTPLWGKDYVPVIRAIRGEAPTTSRASRLQSAQLDRKIHLLSRPELRAALLALYSPRLVDLNEQRALWPYPDLHPLATHPEMTDLPLLPVRGTLDAARRIEPTYTYRAVYVHDVPMHPILVGDLLLVLRDEQGLYCVNWNVKSTHQDYARAGAGLQRAGTVGEGQIQKAKLRERIEELYYADVHIPTYRVTAEEIPDELFRNLKALAEFHVIPSTLSDDESARLVDAFLEGMEKQRPPLITASEAARRGKYQIADALLVFHHGVWERAIRPDLFEQFTVDNPVPKERVDVLERYSGWFARWPE